MKNPMTVVLALLTSLAMINASFAASSAPGVNPGVKEGVAAYRAGAPEKAWPILVSAAEEGDLKAKRYLAYIMLDGAAPSDAGTDAQAGVALLKEAAIEGDYAALIRLEDLRRERTPYSPSLDDMIEIEAARAENGDPVTAWRLAGRYETGDGVAASEADAVKWFEIAASAPVAQFPKADEAAFRLCVLKASGAEAKDPEGARRWCAVAAENGHAGAAIVLRRLASL